MSVKPRLASAVDDGLAQQDMIVAEEQAGLHRCGSRRRNAADRDSVPEERGQGNLPAVTDSAYASTVGLHLLA